VRPARGFDPDAARHAPETIAASALAREPAAQAAARLFARLLGRFAGSLALTFKALGGVYVTGGVASGLAPSRRIRPTRRCCAPSRPCSSPATSPA
jgi:glucokinase